MRTQSRARARSRARTLLGARTLSRARTLLRACALLQARTLLRGWALLWAWARTRTRIVRITRLTGDPAPVGNQTGGLIARGSVYPQNLLMPALAFGAVVFFGALFLADARLYVRVLGLWSFVMTDRVFLDVDYVTAQIACWGKGIDVYRINPCDPLGRVHDYSPLWLRMRFLPPGYGWAKVLGVSQDLAFAASLAFLPAVQGRAARILIAACVLSPTVLFGMERGNVDVGMVVLAVAGLALLERRDAARFFGYGVFLCAGLLKFYPLVLFARALDERPRVFFTLAAAAFAGVAALVLAYGHEVRLAIGNVPLPSDFGDGFAARQVGDGLGFLLHVKALGGTRDPDAGRRCLRAGVADGVAARVRAGVRSADGARAGVPGGGRAAVLRVLSHGPQRGLPRRGAGAGAARNGPDGTGRGGRDAARAVAPRGGHGAGDVEFRAGHGAGAQGAVGPGAGADAVPDGLGLPGGAVVDRDGDAAGSGVPVCGRIQDGRLEDRHGAAACASGSRLSFR